MQKKNERQTVVQFSPAKFKRLPMAEKLAYLRAAFSALGYGLRVVDGQDSGPTPPQPKVAIETAPVRRLLSPLSAMLSKAEFNRLTIEQKHEYLARTHRNLREAAKRWGRTPSST